MTTPRVNDGLAKKLRARQRAKRLGCHICNDALGPIDYDADHLDPLSFQLDHRWQIANGGPASDPNNCASSHRACNRRRSDTIDDIAITAAAEYDIVLTPRDKTTNTDPACAPDGFPCAECDGIHHPSPGIEFITTRTWSTHSERVGYVSS